MKYELQETFHKLFVRICTRFEMPKSKTSSKVENDFVAYQFCELFEDENDKSVWLIIIIQYDNLWLKQIWRPDNW